VHLGPIIHLEIEVPPKHFITVAMEGLFDDGPELAAWDGFPWQELNTGSWWEW